MQTVQKNPLWSYSESLLALEDVCKKMKNLATVEENWPIL